MATDPPGKSKQYKLGPHKRLVVRDSGEKVPHPGYGSDSSKPIGRDSTTGRFLSGEVIRKKLAGVRFTRKPLTEATNMTPPGGEEPVFEDILTETEPKGSSSAQTGTNSFRDGIASFEPAETSGSEVYSDQVPVAEAESDDSTMANTPVPSTPITASTPFQLTTGQFVGGLGTVVALVVGVMLWITTTLATKTELESVKANVAALQTTVQAQTVSMATLTERLDRTREDLATAVQALKDVTKELQDVKGELAGLNRKK